MSRTAALAARPRDLQARSDTSDQAAAAAALAELQQAGARLADAMNSLAAAMESYTIKPCILYTLPLDCA